MPELFGDKKVMVDFINHLEQADYVFLSLQKPIDELTKEEMENALILYIQMTEFWRARYNEMVENHELQKDVIKKQEELIDILERRFDANLKNYK